MDPKSLPGVLSKGATVERLAEEVLTDEQLMKDADQRRNQNREALRAIQKKGLKASDNVWVFDQDVFTRMTAAEAREMLEAHQRELDAQIDSTRDEMKRHMATLADLQDDAAMARDMRGFLLPAVRDRTAIGLFERLT